VYASQLGWLHTKPSESEMTRLELYAGRWDDWPEGIGPVEYLITAALDMYLGVSDGQGGLRPQEWADVVSFGERVAGLTEQWELKALMDMSQSYVTEFMNGRDMLRTTPMDRWRREQEQDGG